MLFRLLSQVSSINTTIPAISYESWQFLLPFGALALVIDLIIPLLFSFLLGGIQIHVFRGGDLNVSHHRKMFCDGLLAVVIVFIYTLPHTVITALTALGHERIWCTIQSSVFLFRYSFLQ